MNTCRYRSAVVAFSTVGALVTASFLGGCDNAARTLGQFPVASAFGPSTLDAGTEPLDPDLFADGEDGERHPLVRIAHYRAGLDGHVDEPLSFDPNADWSERSTYMVIDVTNVLRHPTLGAETDVEYRRRLAKIVQLILHAADWNGDVYWRHFATFLEYYRAADSTAQLALGSGIAATFISPVLGASLAGAGLAIDTFVTDVTDSLDIEDYARLREAASLFRKAERERIYDLVESASRNDGSANDIIAAAYDYAFSYSIKGSLYAVEKQTGELEQYLLTGTSSWKPYFDDERKRLLKDDPDAFPDGAEKERLQQELDHEAALLEVERATELAKAREAKAKAEAAAKEAEQATTSSDG